jgi:hypothetical protein
VEQYLVKITEDREDDAYADLDEAGKTILASIGGTVFGQGFEDDERSRFLTLLVTAVDLRVLRGRLEATVPEGVEVADIIEV